MSENVFPSVETTPFGSKSVGGLTKRELFAAMAMQGAMADGTYVSDSRSHWFEKVACDAVQMADALIFELAKEPKP